MNGAGGGDGVPGITQVSVMRCSCASVSLLRASVAGSRKVMGKKPRPNGFASELFPIRPSFQVRFPHLDGQRTELADVCVRNQQLPAVKRFIYDRKLIISNITGFTRAIYASKVEFVMDSPQ